MKKMSLQGQLKDICPKQSPVRQDLLVDQYQPLKRKLLRHSLCSGSQQHEMKRRLSSRLL
jgi:hypothetical protein